MNKFSIIIVALFFILNSCTNNISDSGGASETIASINVDNHTITGTVNRQDIYTIKVFNSQFIPNIDTSVNKFSDTINSDPNGNFEIQLPMDGSYNLFIFDNIGKSTKFGSLKIYDTTYNMQNTLCEPGILNGSINFLNNIEEKNLLISLPGSDLSTYSESNGEFYLFQIPKGEYSLFYTILDTLDSINDSGNVIDINTEEINSISVESGTTKDIVINIQ